MAQPTYGGSMGTYVFKSIKDPDNKYDISDITFEVETLKKSDLIEQFVIFLQACGYSVEDLNELIG